MAVITTAHMTREQLNSAVLRRKLANIEAAKKCTNAYIEYTSKVPPQRSGDQGERWARQDPLHKEWQEAWRENSRSLILAPVGCGKTTGVRKALEHEMGRNPNILISYLGGSENHPKKQMAAIKDEIERNPRVRHVFPELKKSGGRDEMGRKRRELWSTKSMLIDRPMIHPDPTMQCFGLFGKILGSRSDIIVLDDIINYENSLTEHSRDKIFDWLSEALSRLKPGARVWAIGHIWHEEDALMRLSRKKHWFYGRYECFVLDKDQVIRNIASEAEGISPDDVEITDSLRDDIGDIDLDTMTMTKEEILERVDKGEIISCAPTIMSIKDWFDKIDDLPAIFASMMLWNRLPSNLASRFHDDWFERCLRLGRGLVTPENKTGFKKSWNGGDGLTYTGVDLGHRKKLGSDKTVIFTVAVLPNQTRQIIDIRSGLWKGPEIIRNINEVYQAFGSMIFVESNGAQHYIHDFAEEMNCMPIRDHNTGVQKWDIAHGVESLAPELAQGKWMLPCDQNLIPHPEVGEAIRGCKSFDPTSHTSDHLMAWWICREGIRLSPAVDSMAQEYEIADCFSHF